MIYLNKTKKSIKITDNEAATRAIILLITRIVLVAIFSVLTWFILNVAMGKESNFPPGIMLSGISMFPVNIICFLLTSKFMQQEGQSIRESLAPQKKKILREIGIGMLWEVVLFIPFMLAIMLTAWLFYGNGMFQAFETIFYNPNNEVELSPIVMLILGIITTLTFAPINAPVEEAVYRGYAQSRLIKKWSVRVSIIFSALIFGVQHIFYATTSASAIIYFAAFAMWGAVSGLIVYRQKRLFPIIVAHFLVNLFTSLPALIFPILILVGVIKQ